MPKTTKNKYRYILWIFSLLALSFVVGIRLIVLLGGPEFSKSWTFSESAQFDVIEKGRAHFLDQGWLNWEIPEKARQENAVFELRMKCRWIGQIFFSVNGGAETFLIYNDAREFVPDQPFTLALVSQAGKMAVRFREGDKDLHPPVDVSGPVTSLKIRSSQSEFEIESVTCRQGVDGPVLAEENFGPDPTLFNMLLAIIAVIIFIYMAQVADGLIFRKLFRRKAAISVPTFYTAYLPLVVALVFKPDLVADLLPICIIMRFYIGLTTGRDGMAHLVNFGKWFQFVVVLLLAALFFTHFFRQVFSVHSLWPLFVFATVLTGVVIGIIILIRSLQKIESFNPLALGLRIFLFPALCNYILFGITDGGDSIAVAWVLICGWTLMTIGLLRALSGTVWRYEIFAFCAFLIFVAATEGTLRSSPYASRFRPMNVGLDFDTDDVLFWAPRDLFAPAGENQKSAALQVRKIQFRSGPAKEKKPEGTFRILALGGSNTWGNWIDDPNLVWPQRLEADLGQRFPKQKFQVLNGGVKGYNLFQLLLLYELYLSRYDVDMIIAYININDNAAGKYKGMFTYRELFALRTNGQWGVALSRAGIPEKPGWGRWVVATQKQLQRFSLYNALTKTVLGLRPDDEKIPDSKLLKSVNPIGDYQANLMALINLAKEKNIHLVLADEFTFYPDNSDDEENPYQKTMARIAEKTATPLFPAHKILAESYTRSELVFPWDTVHLNEFGHRELARKMADFLIKNKLIQ